MEVRAPICDAAEDLAERTLQHVLANGAADPLEQPLAMDDLLRFWIYIVEVGLRLLLYLVGQAHVRGLAFPLQHRFRFVACLLLQEEGFLKSLVELLTLLLLCSGELLTTAARDRDGAVIICTARKLVKIKDVHFLHLGRYPCFVHSRASHPAALLPIYGMGEVTRLPTDAAISILLHCFHTFARLVKFTQTGFSPIAIWITGFREQVMPGLGSKTPVQGAHTSGGPCAYAACGCSCCDIDKPLREGMNIRAIYNPGKNALIYIHT